VTDRECKSSDDVHVEDDRMRISDKVIIGVVVNLEGALAMGKARASDK